MPSPYTCRNALACVRDRRAMCNSSMWLLWFGGVIFGWSVALLLVRFEKGLLVWPSLLGMVFSSALTATSMYGRCEYPSPEDAPHA
jgi:hypothetical protein